VLAVFVLVGSALAITQAQASAESTIGFRLSNFSAVVGNICVSTDVGVQCSGKWATGKSEVFQVRYNGLDNWSCSADIVTGGAGFPTASDTPGPFSRRDFKECVLHGALGHPTVDLKA
jgi:hypothetical protein